MAAPVLLRVSVPRWERVARYAVCAAGILLSIYAYHVEREKERDPEHRALCDLGPWVKCSAALASRYPGWGERARNCRWGEGGGWEWGTRGRPGGRWGPGRRDPRCCEPGRWGWGGARVGGGGPGLRPRRTPRPGLRGGGGGAARPARRDEVAECSREAGADGSGWAGWGHTGKKRERFVEGGSRPA